MNFSLGLLIKKSELIIDFKRIYDTKILTNYEKIIKDGLGDGNSYLEKMYELSNLKEY